MKTNRLWIISALGTAVALGVAARITAFSPPAGRLLTATAAAGDIEESVLATGIIKPAQLVAVGSQASGRVVSLRVALGQTVHKADLLAQIDSVPQENALHTAQAALDDIRAQRAQADANLALDESTLKRQRTNAEQKAVSQADLETAQAAVNAARAQIASLDAQIVEREIAVKTAQTDLRYTRITAPMDGTVLAVVTQEGQTVNAVQSAPTILILGQLDILTVRAQISEADVVKVKPGQPIHFTVLGDPDHRYTARLESIEPAPESITSDSSFSSGSGSSTSASSSTTAIYYNGIFHVPNADRRLRTYMTAQVHIVLAQAKRVLTIPASALSRRDGSTYSVQVIGRDGKSVPRTVAVGLNDKTIAEIRSGLSIGERVVTGEATAAEPAAGGGPGGPGGPPPMGF